MKSLELDIPTLGFVVVTRGMLGAGLGLLLAPRIPEERRRAVGTLLFAIGAISTIPALLAVRRGVTRREIRD